MGFLVAVMIFFFFFFSSVSQTLLAQLSAVPDVPSELLGRAEPSEFILKCLGLSAS